MADLQFVEEEPVRFPRSQGGVPSQSARGMTGWLMKKGWVKNPNQAKLVLVAVIVLGFAITIYNLSSVLGGGATAPETPADVVIPPQ